MSLKKTNGVGLKKKEKKSTCIHKSYTDDGKLRMIIVKDQWAAILANLRTFITCHYDRQRQEKLASLILHTKHMLKSITLNDIFNSKVVALYNLDK